MSAFSRSLLLVVVIQTTLVSTGVYAQRRTTEAASAAPVLPEALVSAAKAFRSKTSGQRLGEGWRVLSLIRMNPLGEASKGVTNFVFGPLVSGLSRTNLATLLGAPDLVYTNAITGTNTVCYYVHRRKDVAKWNGHKTSGNSCERNPTSGCMTCSPIPTITYEPTLSTLQFGSARSIHRYLAATAYGRIGRNCRVLV